MAVEAMLILSIPIRRRDMVTDTDRSAIEDFRDEPAAVLERFGESGLARQFTRTLTGVTVLDSPHSDTADRKFLADAGHELNTRCHDIPTTIDVGEFRAIEEPSIDECHLPLARKTIIPAPSPAHIAVTHEPTLSDGFDLTDGLHWSAFDGANEQCYHDSLHW